MDRAEVNKAAFKLEILFNYTYFAHHLGVRSFMCGYCGQYICDLPANAEFIGKILDKVFKHACFDIRYQVWRDAEKISNDLSAVQKSEPQ